MFWMFNYVWFMQFRGEILRKRLPQSSLSPDKIQLKTAWVKQVHGRLVSDVRRAGSSWISKSVMSGLLSNYVNTNCESSLCYVTTDISTVCSIQSISSLCIVTVVLVCVNYCILLCNVGNFGGATVKFNSFPARKMVALLGRKMW